MSNDWDFTYKERPDFKTSESKAPQESDIMRIISLSFPPYLPLSQYFKMKVTGGGGKGEFALGPESVPFGGQWASRVEAYNRAKAGTDQGGKGAVDRFNWNTQTFEDSNLAEFGGADWKYQYAEKQGTGWQNKPTHWDRQSAAQKNLHLESKYGKGMKGTGDYQFNWPGDVIQDEMAQYPKAQADSEVSSYAQWLKELLDLEGNPSDSVWADFQDPDWQSIDPLGEIETQAAAEAMYKAVGSGNIDLRAIGESITAKGGDFSKETIDTIVNTKQERFMLDKIQDIVTQQGGPSDLLTSMDYFEETRGKTKEFWSTHKEWETTNTETVFASVEKSVKHQVKNINALLKGLTEGGILGKDPSTWARMSAGQINKYIKKSSKNYIQGVHGSSAFHLEVLDRIKRSMMDQGAQPKHYGFTGPVSEHGHFGIIKILPVVGEESVEVTFDLHVHDTGITGYAGFIDLAESWAKQDTLAIQLGMDASYFTAWRRRAHDAKALQAGRHLMGNVIFKQQLWAELQNGIFNPGVAVVRGMTTGDIAQSIREQITMATVGAQSKYTSFYQSLLGSASNITDTWKNRVGGGAYTITDNNPAGIWATGRAFQGSSGEGIAGTPYFNSQLGSTTNTRDLEALWSFSTQKGDRAKIAEGALSPEDAMLSSMMGNKRGHSDAAARRKAGNDPWKTKPWDSPSYGNVYDPARGWGNIKQGNEKNKHDFTTQWKKGLDKTPREVIFDEFI